MVTCDLFLFNWEREGVMNVKKGLIISLYVKNECLLHLSFNEKLVKRACYFSGQSKG